MKLLLDENLPHRLRTLLTGHEAFTVAFMNWNGIENGRLLALAADNGFDALITKDCGIEYEHDLNRRFHPASLSLGRAAQATMVTRGVKSSLTVSRPVHA